MRLRFWYSRNERSARSVHAAEQGLVLRNGVCVPCTSSEVRAGDLIVAKKRGHRKGDCLEILPIFKVTTEVAR
jgi:hypothetical protein